ncbi:hypothetical protein CSUI_000128 [Cystoisospora suis]|uniref:Uncharacterized protein n=1 Tax=Cystoisospora suis TaxID=483139 RepID=A0A2C6LDD0_9APIC|nr:hypothetical protein CSUI_000128 [Cystoisospora suis]
MATREENIPTCSSSSPPPAAVAGRREEEEREEGEEDGREEKKKRQKTERREELPQGALQEGEERKKDKEEEKEKEDVREEKDRQDRSNDLLLPTSHGASHGEEKTPLTTPDKGDKTEEKSPSSSSPLSPSPSVVFPSEGTMDSLDGSSSSSTSHVWLVAHREAGEASASLYCQEEEREIETKKKTALYLSVDQSNRPRGEEIKRSGGGTDSEKNTLATDPQGREQEEKEKEEGEEEEEERMFAVPDPIVIEKRNPIPPLSSSSSTSPIGNSSMQMTAMHPTSSCFACEPTRDSGRERRDDRGDTSGSRGEGGDGDRLASPAGRMSHIPPDHASQGVCTPPDAPLSSSPSQTIVESPSSSSSSSSSDRASTVSSSPSSTAIPTSQPSLPDSHSMVPSTQENLSLSSSASSSSSLSSSSSVLSSSLARVGSPSLSSLSHDKKLPDISLHPDASSNNTLGISSSPSISSSSSTALQLGGPGSVNLASYTPASTVPSASILPSASSTLSAPQPRGMFSQSPAGGMIGREGEGSVGVKTEKKEEKKSLAAGDLKRFGGVFLTPGKPRKWSKVMRRIGNVRGRVWVAKPNSEDDLLQTIRCLLNPRTSLGSSNRRTVRHIRAIAEQIRDATQQDRLLKTNKEKNKESQGDDLGKKQKALHELSYQAQQGTLLLPLPLEKERETKEEEVSLQVHARGGFAGEKCREGSDFSCSSCVAAVSSSFTSATSTHVELIDSRKKEEERNEVVVMETQRIGREEREEEEKMGRSEGVREEGGLKKRVEASGEKEDMRDSTAGVIKPEKERKEDMGRMKEEEKERESRYEERKEEEGQREEERSRCKNEEAKQKKEKESFGEKEEEERNV